ncbi:sulfite exporter TauE/SafE family protein [Thiomicrorhabdus aquaedulcis]|uniref:sulfite exporter TauE/SafE family protein n=1 Tax=Thiomicrorhabdus aquaedulcis TaxID=2211106 RepID=UPI000FDB96A5|nr:sulfite exporter TauE/SafE family protein [Thiomicrorhabdus aquaedulcis]
MILAWMGALVIGITLGLLGSGGSILTVPVLTYLVGQEIKVAIAGSLMIVGIISLFSVIPYARQGLVKWRTVVVFGVPGMVGAMAGAWGAHFVSDAAQMLVFASLLIIASYLMFKPVALPEGAAVPKERAVANIALDGLVVGAVTGLVGVGGGFLIIPALVLLGGLSMRLAVGTSLMIIAIKSFAGFVGYIPVLEALNLQVDWHIIGIFSVIGIVGGWLGHKISSRINQNTLKQGFAVFLVLMGAFILYEHVPTLF